MLFRLQGHEVQVAFSGVAALEMTGMDGYDVALRMREQPELEQIVLAALTG
jgi:hypothetical protein